MDWARHIIGSSIVSITAHALPDGARYNRDNVVATLAFEDGSISNVSYLANGDRSIPKEEFEVFCEGKVGRISDFRILELARDGKTKRTKMKWDKGHEREIELTIDAMRGGGPSPIPFEQLIEVSQATIAIQEAIATGTVVLLGAPTKLMPAVSVRSSEP